VLGFADSDPTKLDHELLGLKVIATRLEEVLRLARNAGAAIGMGVGSNQARQRLFEKLIRAQAEVGTVVHASAVVAPSARIGRGSVVMAGVVINPDSVVGENVILNTGVSVDHDCFIGDHAHLSPGVHLGGTVRVGEGTHLGIGTVVRNNLNIGEWSVIGAGAAVVSDIPDRVMAYGVPARLIKEISR